jgi:hypothetical protein
MRRNTSSDHEVILSKLSNSNLFRQLLRHALTLVPLSAIALAGCAADEPEPPVCDAPQMFRVTQIQLPARALEARQMGEDLNGDRAVDNQLGMLVGSLETYFDTTTFDLSGSANERLASDVMWTFALRTCSDGSYTLTSNIGSVPGTVELAGRLDPGRGTVHFTGTGGALPLSLLFDPGHAQLDPGWQTGLTTAAELSIADDGVRLDVLRFGMAVEGQSALGAIVAPMTPFLDARAATDNTIREEFDRNKDGHITLDEVTNASLTRSLLAPDLVVDGTRALSIGFALTARR